jgi:uncharacterized protein (DUF58 family)
MNWLKLSALALLILFLGQLNRWKVFDKLFFVLLGLLVVSFVWSRLSLRGLTVTRWTATDRAQVGDLLVERVRVENTSRFAKLWLEVLDHSELPGHRLSRVIHLGPRDSANWKAQTWCTRRGRFRLGPMTISSGDPFGLFPTRLVVPYVQELVVYPATVDLSGFRLPHGELAGGSALQRRTPFVTPNAAGIRQYLPGDSFNRIAWSATARTGQLMVKEFELDPSTDIWVVLDMDQRHHVRAAPEDGARRPTGRDALPLSFWLDSTEEYAVTIAASLARHFLDQNRNVGIIANAHQPVVIPADRGARQMVKILELLAVLRADGDRPLAEVLLSEASVLTRHCAVVVLTPSTEESWVRGLVELAARRARSIAVIVEPSTFGGAESSLFVVSDLAAVGVPTYLVKYGDDIARALAGQGRGAGVPVASQ